jgi:hypothetical protein
VADPGGVAEVSAEVTNEVVTRQLAAVNAHDPDAVVALIAPDAVCETPTLPGGEAVGPGPLRADYAALFRAFPDLVVEELDRLLSPDGGSAAILWRARATHAGPLDPPGFAPTGVRGQSRGMSHTEVRGGRIVHFRLYYDLTDLGRQIGAVPPVGSAAERVSVMLQRAKARSLRRRAR